MRKTHIKNPVMKQNMDAMYEALKKRVEKVVGRSMVTPRDFDYLAMRLFDANKVCISSTTLKRFWGYIEGCSPRRQTLSLLSQFVGYGGWEQFCEHSSVGGVIESDFILNNAINVSSLSKGVLLRLTWAPDRCVTIRYEGLEMFKVMESLNSKLSIGDTFQCSQIIEGEPLFLRCLVHEGGSPTNYVCGKIGGVLYRIVG